MRMCESFGATVIIPYDVVTSWTRAMILKGKCDAFIDFIVRIVPIRVYRVAWPGDIMGPFRSVSPEAVQIPIPNQLLIIVIDVP